jgi:hypothetical protein
MHGGKRRQQASGVRKEGEMERNVKFGAAVEESVQLSSRSLPTLVLLVCTA